jgi:hypothetical protein
VVSQARRVSISGNLAYVSNRFGGLRILDITDPASPTEVGYYDTPGFANDSKVVGSLIYVVDELSFEILRYNPSVGIEEDNEKLIIKNDKLILLQNHPNPFHELTAISYQLGAPSHTSLKIYDITGRLIETLVDEVKDSGVYQVEWNGKDQASGIYFYRLQSDNLVSTKKMILLR